MENLKKADLPPLKSPFQNKPRKAPGSEYLEGKPLPEIWMCGPKRVSGPEAICSDGSKPVCLGTQLRIPGEPEKAKEYREQHTTPEFVMQDTKVANSKEESKVASSLEESKVASSLEEYKVAQLGGMGGPPAGGTMSVPMKDKKPHCCKSKEIKMMTSPDKKNKITPKIDDNSDIDQAGEDLGIEG